MANILIRNISPLTKERLRQRAERRGKSLEADLRETLEGIAEADAGRPRATNQQGFGSWLVAVSRPGADLSRALDKVRRAPLRSVDLDWVRVIRLDTNVVSEGLRPFPSPKVIAWLDAQDEWLAPPPDANEASGSADSRDCSGQRLFPRDTQYR